MLDIFAEYILVSFHLMPPPQVPLGSTAVTLSFAAEENEGQGSTCLGACQEVRCMDPVRPGFEA